MPMNWNEQRSLLQAAIGDIADLLDDVTDFSAPGLGEWDLGGLVGHFLRALRTPVDYLQRPLSADSPLPDAAAYYTAYLEMREADPEAVDSGVVARGNEEMSMNPDHPAVAIRADASQLDHQLQEVGPNRLLQTLVGPMRLEDYMRTRIMEVVVHGLDISRAVERDWQPPAPLLADCLQLLTTISLRRGSAESLVLLLTGREDLAGSDVLPVLR